VTAAVRSTVTPLWAAIAVRDGRRCTCTGQCGSKHYTRIPGKPAPAPGSPATRCDVEAPPELGSPGRRLIVAPVDPRISETQAAYLPAAELTLWCPECSGAAVRRARGPARRTRAVAPADTSGENPGLF
jgi:hypothetical protein